MGECRFRVVVVIAGLFLAGEGCKPAPEILDDKALLERYELLLEKKLCGQSLKRAAPCNTYTRAYRITITGSGAPEECLTLHFGAESQILVVLSELSENLWRYVGRRELREAELVQVRSTETRIDDQTVRSALGGLHDRALRHRAKEDFTARDVVEYRIEAATAGIEYRWYIFTAATTDPEEERIEALSFLIYMYCRLSMTPLREPGGSWRLQVEPEWRNLDEVRKAIREFKWDHP